MCYIIKHIKFEDTHGNVRISMANKRAKHELINLNIRLIIYTFFVAGSCIVFVYLSWQGLVNYDAMLSSYIEYFLCLAASGESGDNSNCAIDQKIDPILYYLEGIICILVSSGSFVLSCTPTRISKIKDSMSSVGSRSKKSGIFSVSSNESKARLIDKKKEQEEEYSRMQMVESTGRVNS